MTLEPLPVSVLIPAFNAARFVPAAIETIRSQSVPVDEIIIVDDGSTDETAAVGERLGARVLRQRRGGPAGARNAGLRAAKNAWIATLDADDVWHPQKLQLQFEAVRAETSLGLVFTDFDALSASEHRIHLHNVVSARASFRTIRRTPLTPSADLLDTDGFLRDLAARPIIQPSTALFRRDLALRVGGFPTNLRAEDTDFFLRLVSRTKSGFVNLPLVGYMQHPSQMTANRELDAVRLELHHHVMAHRSDYHDIVIAVFVEEYARALYYGAAHRARQKRFASASVLFAKAVGAAVHSGQLRALASTVLQSRAVRASLGRSSAGNMQPTECSAAVVHDIEIPWRRSNVRDRRLLA